MPQPPEEHEYILARAFPEPVWTPPNYTSKRRGYSNVSRILNEIDLTLFEVDTPDYLQGEAGLWRSHVRGEAPALTFDTLDRILRETYLPRIQEALSTSIPLLRVVENGSIHSLPNIRSGNGCPIHPLLFSETCPSCLALVEPDQFLR